MAVFLSPGVYPREIDLSVLPSAVGALTPAFIGTAKKGPLQEPTYVTNAQQFIDTFGEPFPESFLGYAVLAYFEEGNRAYVLRVGVECEQGQPADLANICIDNSGSRGKGWGRIPVFSGIDHGKICTRVISADAPMAFHQALVSDINYNDAFWSPTEGAATATLTFSDIHGYQGALDDSYTVLITSDVPVTGGSLLDGATFEVIRNSDGMTILNDTIVESVTPGTSEPIDIGDGLIFQIVVSGTVAIGAQDIFTFVTRPDNRQLSFNVDHANTVNEYTITDGSTFTSAVAFADAVNLLVSSEDYKAIAKIDGTVCFTTNVAGESIQLVSREGFALEIGQALYAYDIPRSYLQSTNPGPYIISTENNRVSINVVAANGTTTIDFSVPVGTVPPATIATNINLGGVKNGDKFWTAYAMLTPGGDEQVFIETTANHQFDQLVMLADLAHLKTLRFAEELNVLYPYTKAYRTFNDLRVILPESGTVTPSVPLSCESAPSSDECAADSAYFQNIVGFFVATSAGTWINGYKLSLLPLTTGNGGGDAAGMFNVQVKNAAGQLIENIENVSFDATADRYIGNVVNPGSKYGGTNGDPTINWIPRPSFLGNDPVNDPANYVVRVPGAIYDSLFVGAANGIPDNPAYSTELDRAIIGTPAEETGIYALQNPEVYDITLLVIPGASSGAVIGQGLTMCENRGDCMMIIDPPIGLRAQQVVAWHNGMLFSDLAQAVNSSYGALYTPWLKIYDQFSGNTIFVPPSGHVSGVYARTARVAEQWFAPAGLNRGHLLTPLDTEVDLTQGERDLLYGSGNAVNPIVNFPVDGITVWGQRTLQRKATALDRVNVRLLLIYIKKNATQFLRQFVFEPNDATTRAAVTTVSNSFLADIMARRGLTGFAVVCDERNNTPERIDRNELHVSFFVKPTRAAEFIQLNVVILKTESSFTASEILAAGGVAVTA